MEKLTHAFDLIDVKNKVNELVEIHNEKYLQNTQPKEKEEIPQQDGPKMHIGAIRGALDKICIVGHAHTEYGTYITAVSDVIRARLTKIAEQF